MGTHITKHADDAAFASEGSMQAKEEASKSWQSNGENCILWSKENYWKSRDINEYCPLDRTLIYTLHERNSFMIFKIDSLCTKIMFIVELIEKLLKLIKNTLKKSKVQALVGAS